MCYSPRSTFRFLRMNLHHMPSLPAGFSARKMFAAALSSAIGLAEDYWKDGGAPPPMPVMVEPVSEEEEEKPSVPLRWNADRCKIMETLWGIGQVLPGGGMTDALVAPLGLNKEMSVLDLSAGLGALARKLAEEFNTYVTGMEPDAVVAARGMEMSVAAGKSKHATVESYEPTAFESHRHYDCIIARELFYRVSDKKKMLKSVADALKSHGQLVFTDYILDSGRKGDPAIAAWLAHETDASPLSMNEMVKMCGKLGLDVRINEDQTAIYRREVMMGLKSFMAFLIQNKPDKETGGLALMEVENWIHRASAMEKGLQFCRFYAIKSF